MKIIKNIVNSCDRLEDRVRKSLSRFPIVYAFIGGVGVVLFWRGVWHLADDISMASAVSLFLGTFILLITGIFVSEFVGKRLIITGLIGEKKLEEKEVGEIQTEEMQIKNLQTTLTRLENKLDHIDGEIENRH